MEKIGRVISHQPIPTQRNGFKYAMPMDDPSYVEPSPEQKREDYLLESGVSGLKHNFKNIRCPEGFKETLKAFKKMADKPDKPILFVFGRPGNGKSLCCEALVIALYDSGIRAKRERWSDVVRFRLKGGFGKKGGEGYEHQFRLLLSCPFLILDDVGMGSTANNWEWGELEDILDYRLEHGLPTVMTTNLDNKDIPPRIVSRLRDSRKCRLVHNKASDQRGTM